MAHLGAVPCSGSTSGRVKGNLGLLSSPEKRYTASRVQIVLDDFNVEAIRKEVHAFYGRKEYPTLDSLLGVLRVLRILQNH